MINKDEKVSTLVISNPNQHFLSKKVISLVVCMHMHTFLQFMLIYCLKCCISPKVKLLNGDLALEYLKKKNDGKKVCQHP